MPLTAIITRTKNRPLLLERAVKSVLSQTNQDWVHVIVNDGGDKVVVEKICDSYLEKYNGRLMIIHNKISKGMEAASNLGISSSNSEFIVIHDDDDTLNPGFLDKTVSFLLNPPYSTIRGVATITTLVKERIVNNEVKFAESSIFKKLPVCICMADVLGINPIPPISFLFRRSVYESIGPFDETLPVLGDWEFLIRFIQKYDIGVIQEALANYHIRPFSVGASINSIHEDKSRFIVLTSIIRNRVARDASNPVIGMLIQQSADFEKLQRIYQHPILGRIIRFWSKYINSSIPYDPR